MARNNGPRPGDFTGAQKAKLAKEHADEVARREGELSMMEASEAEAAQNRVTDYTGSQPVILDDIEDLTAADEELLLGDDAPELREQPHRTIRVNADLENVTIGVGNHYTFREGEKYKVPVQVAQHLEEKGYVWH